MGERCEIRFDSVAWPATTIVTASYGLVYNSSLTGNNAVYVLNFGRDYAGTGGFTVNFPLTEPALIRI